jgi:hypothetical protein
MTTSFDSIKRLVLLNKYLSIAVGYLLCMATFWFVYHNDPIITPIIYYAYSSILYVLLLLALRKAYFLIRKDQFYLYFILATIAASILALSPVIFKHGWPLNHDHLTWKIHTRTWAAHISQFDLIPLWSSRDGAGMGVPTPLYYHKLFYVVSSFFYILLGKIKASIILTLMSFMIAGIIGIYKVALYLGNKKWIAMISSLSLIFFNYSMSNWFLRGAMAEFAAMMIIPFLFYEELKLLRTKQYSHRLGVIILLLGLSHSVIGYYSVFTVIATLLILSFSISGKQAFKVLKGLLLSAMGVIALYLVYLVPMVFLSGDFNPSKIKGNGSLPQNNLVKFSRYFYDSQYEWFSEPYWGYSVQLDLPVLCIMLLILLAFLLKIKRLKNTFSPFSIKAIGLILLINTFFILLQTPASVQFYENVPGADFAQFPWRLLSFIQVLNLMILLWLCGQLYLFGYKRLLYFLMGLFLLCTIILYPAFRKTEYWWYTDEEVEAMVHTTCNVGEYLPDIFGTKYSYLKEQMYLLADRNIEIKEEGNVIEQTNKHDLHQEALFAAFYANIKQPTDVILPITYSELTRLFQVDAATGEKKQLPIYRTAADPRIRTFLPYGEYDLKAYLPTLMNIFIPKPKYREAERIELIESNTEMLSANKLNLISIDKRHLLSGAEIRTDEKARSGTYSIKLSGPFEYGFDFELNSKKVYGEDLRVSVWRHGSPRSALVIEAGGKVFIRQETASATDSLGWEQLVIDFKIPPEIDRNDLIKIYVHRSKEEEVTYFDDFRFEFINKLEPLWHTSTSKSGYKTVEGFIREIKNNESWMESIRLQAIEKNISLDSNIYLHALWMVEHQKTISEEAP